MHFEVDSEKQYFEIQLASILVFFGYSLHEHRDTSSLSERNLKPHIFNSINNDLLTLYIAFYRGLVNSIIDLNRDHVSFNGYALNKDLVPYCEKAQSIYSVSADDVSADMSPSGYKTTYDLDTSELVKKFSSSLFAETFRLAFTNSRSIRQHEITNLYYLRNNCCDYSIPLNYDNYNHIFKCLYVYDDISEEMEQIKTFGELLGHTFIKITPRSAWASYFENESQSNFRPIVFAQLDLQTITTLTLKFLNTNDYNERKEFLMNLLDEIRHFDYKM